MAVTTSRPDAAFDGQQVDAFVDIVASLGDRTLATHAGGGRRRGADPCTEGKGKKKGIPRSPSRPM